MFESGDFEDKYKNVLINRIICPEVAVDGLLCLDILKKKFHFGNVCLVNEFVCV